MPENMPAPNSLQLSLNRCEVSERKRRLTGDTDSGELFHILASGSWEPILDVDMVLINARIFK
jgi:hypothetical protein